MSAGLGGCAVDTLVSSHDAFGYLADRYGLEVVGITGLSPSSEPSADQLAEITDLLLGETRARLTAQGISVEFAPEAVRWLAERSHEPEFGARPLRRTIQRSVDNPVSRLVLSGALAAGGHLVVGVVDGELDLVVEQPLEEPVAV